MDEHEIIKVTQTTVSRDHLVSLPTTLLEAVTSDSTSRFTVQHSVSVEVSVLH